MSYMTVGDWGGSWSYGSSFGRATRLGGSASSFNPKVVSASMPAVVVPDISAVPVAAPAAAIAAMSAPTAPPRPPAAKPMSTATKLAVAGGAAWALLQMFGKGH